MKVFRTLFLCAALLGVAALAIPFVAGAAGNTILDDTFADGSSVNQLLPNSARIFKGRSTTVRADAVGSVTYDMTATGTNSEAFWGYFTNSGSPVTLAVGDKLSVSGVFSMTGFVGTGQDIRFGVLNSLGTRNVNDLTGGQNDVTFSGDPGYALGFFASGTGSPFVVYRRTNLNVNNVFNTFGDFTAIAGTGATARQALTNNTPYTLNYTIERLTATETKISVSVTGGALNNLSYTATESSVTPNNAFDYFAFRIGGTNFAQKLTFTNWKVEHTPALPIITSQPQPTNLTVQVGSNVTMSVAASGNSLAYQWQRNGAAIAGNASAATPTLNLTNVQLSEAGSYTALVSNASGGVTSQPVTLNVSVEPVPPPPSVSTQPADTTAPVGGPSSLSVAATGDGLFYQWFRNGALIPGATQATLGFASAQVSDSADYYVVVSNSSGSVTSSTAKLLVVSTMQATGFAPSNYASGVDVDAPLYLTFNQPPALGSTGRLRVFSESGALVDTIDMSLATQSRPNGTVTFNYRPIIVNGNTAAIYLHQKLAYNTSYYVTLEPGVVRDAAGAPFVGFGDATAWNFSTKTSAPAAGSSQLTVAADGSGDFATVQGAVDFVPASNTKRVVIYVRKGTYTEIVYVNSNKPFVTVRGEDRNLSVIQYANNNNFNPTSTTHRAMFGVDAADFTLENITLRNTTPQGGSQAEAFRGNNNRIVLNRVNLYSFQDTLLLQGQSNQGGFVTDSYIEGDVDFMWGSGAVFFQNTEMKMLRTDAFYDQARNGSGRNGYVYVNCKFTRAAGINGSYLNRIDPDDFPFSQVVLINSQLDGVRADPWQFNNPSLAVNATNYPNIRMWEYKSRDLSGNLVDVSQRAAISRQLTDAEAAQWSDPAFVLGGWVPQTTAYGRRHALEPDAEFQRLARSRHGHDRARGPARHGHLQRRRTAPDGHRHLHGRRHRQRPELSRLGDGHARPRPHARRRHALEPRTHVRRHAEVCDRGREPRGAGRLSDLQRLGRAADRGGHILGRRLDQRPELPRRHLRHSDHLRARRAAPRGLPRRRGRGRQREGRARRRRVPRQQPQRRGRGKSPRRHPHGRGAAHHRLRRGGHHSPRHAPERQQVVPDSRGPDGARRRRHHRRPFDGRQRQQRRHTLPALPDGRPELPRGAGRRAVGR